MFHIMLLTAWTLFHLHILGRALSLPIFKRSIRRLVLILAIILLWISYFLPGIADRFGAGSLSAWLEQFSMNWLGTSFLLFTCLLIVDLVTLFGILFKKYRTHTRSAAFVAGILLSIFALYQGYGAPVIREYEVTLANLPSKYDGLVLVAVSDLHVGTFLDETWLAQRVDQVNALKPDVVVLLGDFFEGDNRDERKRSMIDLFRKLSARLGVFGVTGNHESYGGLDSTIRFLEEAGVHMLRNRWSEPEPGIVIAGVDDGHERNQTAGAGDKIERALAGRPDSSAVIFLSHRPVGAERAAAAGAELMLSGHTHGGQLWPFYYISAMYNPLMAGEYVINGMPVIVSRGTGTWGPRMRLWYPSEILRIVLRSR